MLYTLYSILYCLYAPRTTIKKCRALVFSFESPGHCRILLPSRLTRAQLAGEPLLSSLLSYLFNSNSMHDIVCAKFCRVFLTECIKVEWDRRKFRDLLKCLISTFIEICWNLMKVIEIYWKLLKSIEIYSKSLKRIEINWNTLRLFEIIWNSLQSIENHWNLFKSIDSHWNSIEIHWNPMKSIEIHWNLLTSIENNWNVLTSFEV